LSKAAFELLLCLNLNKSIEMDFAQDLNQIRNSSSLSPDVATAGKIVPKEKEPGTRLMTRFNDLNEREKNRIDYGLADF
jgi:hypothetical protein